MKKSHITRPVLPKTLLHRTGNGLRIAFFLFLGVLLPTVNAYAQSEDWDYRCIADLACSFYDPNSCGSDVSTPTDNSGATSGTWNSGLQPPYIVEQFAIETLKDVAAKMGVQATSALTQEHVIALVAFMFGEGGDINNFDQFNLLNTGIDAPDLIQGGHDVSGVQSFKSFDAGVEATARTMVGSNQNRLATLLTEPSSSAEQFMQALTFYKNYPGNSFWAAASVSDPEGYYRQRLTLVQQVRSKYADMAGLEIGVMKDGQQVKEQELNLTDKSLLQFHPAGDTSSTGDVNTSSDTGCQGGASGSIVQGDIVKTALALAWPNIIDPTTNANHVINPGDPDDGKAKATPLYQTTMPTVNGSKGIEAFSDCGVFTSTVILAAGVDSNYPHRGTTIQKAYVRAHPEKYIIITDPTSTDQLQPGDILIGDEHTYIYTGAYTGNDGKSYNAAAASLAETSPGHAPQADHWYRESDFIAARVKSNAPTPRGGPVAS